MSKITESSDGMRIFYCEGCKQCHGFNNSWTFNGDFENPTFSPSILVKGVEPITDEEYDLLMAGKYVKPRPFVCHSFVADGKIQYLNDCTHSLAGKTIGLKDESEWFDGSQ